MAVLDILRARFGNFAGNCVIGAGIAQWNPKDALEYISSIFFRRGAKFRAGIFIRCRDPGMYFRGHSLFSSDRKRPGLSFLTRTTAENPPSCFAISRSRPDPDFTRMH